MEKNTNKEYRETLVKTLSIIVLIVIFSIFVIIVSILADEKLNFKYPDRIIKIEKNGKSYIEWDKITLKEYLKLLIGSEEKEYKLIREKVFSYGLKIKEENLLEEGKKKELVYEKFRSEKIFNSEIKSINVFSGKYYRNENKVLKETVKVLKVTVYTKDREYKDILVTLDYKNKIEEIKIRKNKDLNRLQKLESMFNLISKKNIYKYFAAVLRSDIRIQRVVLNKKPLEK